MRTARFLRDRRGAAALEFGALAMVLMGLCYGSVEVAQAFAAAAKVKGVAESVAQLVALEQTATNAELADICTAAQMMMTPFMSAALGIEVVDVTIDSKNAPVVSWRSDSCAANGTTAVDPVIAGLAVAPGDNVVVVRASYVFTSPLLFFMPSAITLRADQVVRPRYGTVGRSAT
jgi:Flp pilus assembly protein TadG